MALTRGRPRESRGPWVKIWPRKWDGRKTFLRILAMDPDPDRNWFQTHYVAEDGGTLPCTDDCRYCDRGVRQETKLYVPAVLYVFEVSSFVPGPYAVLELRETPGRELERIFRPGILIEVEREAHIGVVVRQHHQQAGQPPMPRPFSVEMALRRFWKLPVKDQEEEGREAV